MKLNLNHLNKEQKKAVTFGEGPVLIVAGAGTGKTTVITYRLAYLIKQGKAKPEEVLAVTFTDKAAEEMEARVDKLLPFGYIDLWVSTFHSFCNRVLKDRGLDIGLSSDFKILDETSSWLLVRQNLEKFKLDYYKPLGNPTKFIHALVSHFSRCKDQAIYPEDYLKYSKKVTDSDAKRIKEIANAYQKYQNLLLENNLLDFGDLINYCLRLFQKRQGILKEYRKKFKYILVDEFQDTNWAQYELVKLLAAPKNNLTVSADDDQCLPPNTIVDVKGGKKKIKQIKVNDLVVTAVGKGHLSYAKVKQVFHRRKKARLLTFKTSKGYKIQVTDNHKMFCFTPRRVSDKKYYYVYLMRRDNIGWRLGTTNDLAVRLKIERSADRILAIKSCQSEEEARFYETLYSLKYSIPTTCFKERESVMVKGDWMIKLYKEINVEKGVEKLAKDLRIDLNAHHYSLDAVTRGSSRRVKINLNMCKRRYKSKYAKNNFLVNPLIYHQVVVVTSNKEIVEKLKRARFNLTKAKLTKSKKGYQFRVESKDIKKIGRIAEELQRITGGILECGFVIGKTNIVSQKALVMPASNVLPGLYLPVVTEKGVIYDQVKEVKTETKTLTVYDLEVERTHNFVANGVIVHNSIYKFRGASFGNIIQFRKDFPRAKEIVLTKNYRSPQNLLDLAYKFIQLNNPNRLEYLDKINKHLLAVKKEKGIIEHLRFKTLEQEVSGVVNKIIAILNKNKKTSFADFAILVRANKDANIFSRALERADIPYQFMALRGLYSKAVILDVISYFKLLDNYHESSAVSRILNLPFLEVPFADIAKINQYSIKKAQSTYQSLQELSLIPNLSKRVTNSIKHLLTLIKKHSFLTAQKNVSEIFIAFLKDSGYLEYLAKKGDSESFDYINQFFDKIKAFEESNLDPSLRNFIEELNMELESGEQGKLGFDIEWGPDTVKIMTVHAAKGLEFKYVFLVNLVDKKFPTIERKEPIEIPKSLVKDIIPEGDIHLEEERRLFYVGMTRVKKGLFFSSAEDYGSSKKSPLFTHRKLSRFLRELGYPDFVEDARLCRHGKDDKKIDLGSAIFQRTNISKRNKPARRQAGQKVLLDLPNYFSFTQIRAFENCPLQYKFAHILRIPVRGRATFSYGKTMHITLFKFVRQAIKKQVAFKELIGIYEQQWIDDWYNNKKQKEEYFELGKKALKMFYNGFLKTKSSILFIENTPALEQNFNLKINNNTFIGKIDRIDKTADKVEIIDYKTGKMPDKLKSEDREQLLIYQIAAGEVFGLKPEKLTYYYLDSGKKLSFLGSKTDIEKQKQKIISQIEQIKNSDFSATPGWHCKTCDFKDICEHAQ